MSARGRGGRGGRGRGGSGKGKERRVDDKEEKQEVKKSHEWSYQSTLTVCVPEELHPEIQAIRKVHDKAYDRWMPHLNIMFPFVIDTHTANNEQLDKAIELASEELRKFPSFEMEFPTINSFNQGKRQTVHLKPVTNPPSAFRDLYKRLMKVFPQYIKETNGRQELLAHLTIGQWDSSVDLKDLDEELKLDLVKSTTILVDRVSVATRNGDVPFSVKKEILLGPMKS
eukprot:CAMPEP_0201524342 /NCGR_PEP_ID=MMETSP0161_2-20130828/21262_1 /ASSEMBLY_ACC=CAM_ASM_000251 /TAXON_ID=180227 /ORGANISM="Neoparamoeba aestuarina, Strain SoJaBio B1-5/56/2" /LENGTH=226 /DNA_ID=CAMNT_0047923675 /DNA_START=252 /DNA_END=932 /DNA_ORIENTATION=-